VFTRQRFSGVYVREQLRYALEAIPSGLNAVLTCRPSGQTTVECRFRSLKIRASLPATSAHGRAHRALTAAQITDLKTRLAQHGRIVRMAVSDGPIVLRRPR
jgi:hypothetical protein